MNKIITKEEIQKTLENYSLGKLISIKRLNRRCEHLQPSFIIKTEGGKYFFKQYWEFDYSKKKGLEFNIFLQKKRYPCNKVILTKKSRPFFKINGIFVSIFEFLPYKEKENMNLKECYELGKGLAKLHNLSKDYKNIKEVLSPTHYLKEFKEYYHFSENAPKIIKEIFENIKLEYPKIIKKMSGLPKGICHTEYTIQHTRFYNNKLVSVIDWDLINKSYLLYDLGTTLSTTLEKTKINFEKMKAILKGYESIRKLSKKEKETLFEAVELGIFKFITWGLNKEEIEKSGWENIGLVQANILMKLGKKDFYRKLLP
jgi:homoserine kinase type II